MRLQARLKCLEDAAQDLGRADWLDVVLLCSIADAEGQPPELHRVGTPGSTGGV